MCGNYHVVELQIVFDGMKPDPKYSELMASISTEIGFSFPMIFPVFENNRRCYTN